MTTTSFSFGSRCRLFLAAGLALVAAACSGGGDSVSNFNLVESNLNNLQHWQINRTMTFRFSQPVNLGSVNLNTISILREGVTPAAGSFFLQDAYTVAFQPTCPSQAGFADAGLTPGGFTYIVHVVGSVDGGATVRSIDGESLGLGLTTQVITPDSDDLAVLFDDTQPGPPSPLIWDGTGPTEGFSYLEEGGNPDQRVFFQPRAVPSLALGADVPVGYLAPLNLYSVDASRLGIFVQIDQPVDPSASNINSTAVKLQYCSDPAGGCGTNPAQWVEVAHEVLLLSNCVNGGATIQVSPVGILPQGRLVRVVLASSFRDLVGNGNLLDFTVASFEVVTAIDPDTMLPIIVEDEFLEPFTIPGGTAGSSQDFTALLDAPAAHWGQAADPGDLVAGFDFGGTGGPGGNFDWVIEQLPGNGSTILNTSFAVITNPDQSASQTVVNGQVDVHNLTVNANAVLEIKGPNSCTIRASGTVRIDGKIVIKGSNNRGVVTFSTTNIPEPGASGNGGGGRGGTGNILTNQSTPAGETGYGAFGAVNAGGGGGETGYNPDNNLENRRGGGGGGGALGPPMTLFTPNPVPPTNTFNVNGCPDQRIIGLDAEDGNPGSINASGAIGGTGQRPRGGLKGTRPFPDSNPSNDFFGILRAGTSIVRGELVQSWAGAGGGGGGNCVTASVFPNPNWTTSGDEKGAGGGGGGGSLTLLVLGDVIFGVDGRIDAGGGTGGGGENSNGNNRIGGGSGGGSAGHVIIQVGRTIDFTATRSNQALERNKGGVWARGGQGGAGRQDAGGAMADAVETSPTLDRLPRDHYTVAQGGIVDPPPCLVAAAGNSAGGQAGQSGIPGCGGDGGPGIIQLHAPTLADIRTPTASGETLFAMLKPNPVGTTITVGSTAAANTSNVNTPAAWNQLLPTFGRVSKAQSRWIALGATSVSPTSTVPEPTEFIFDGLDAGGLVEKSGSGDDAMQIELPSIFTGTGSQSVVAEPNTPYVTADDRSVVFDGTTVIDEVYLRNPSLLRLFDLKFVVGATTTHFDVGSATYDTTSGLLRVTVTGSGAPLSAVPSNGTASVSLHPRFYRVKTDGNLDSLPDPASIRIEFQATTANAVGAPDESAGALTAWTSDVAVLNSDPENPLFRFFRFRVTFDLGLTELSADTPVPALDYLRVPFRF